MKTVPIRIIFASGFLSLGFVWMCPMPVHAETSKPISSGAIERNFQALINEIERSDNPSEMSLFDYDRYITLFERMGEIPGAAPEATVMHINTLRKLGHKFQGNDAYLYVTGQLVGLGHVMPEELSEMEVKSLAKFFKGLPENHGHKGSVHKVRLVNALSKYYPERSEDFQKMLNVEELLFANTWIASSTQLYSFPQPEEFSVVGGDALYPLLEDPSLDFVDKVARLSPQKRGENRMAWAENIASIGRYHYFRGITPNASSVRSAKKVVEKAREEWHNEPFIRSSVLYAATNDEEKQFLNEEHLDRFQEIAPEVSIFASKTQGKESAREARDEFLEAVTTTEGPITAVISMHGNEEVVLFQGTEDEDEAELWVDELAEAFAIRYSNGKSGTEADVLILENCSSGTYGIIFLEYLSSLKLPLPIVIMSGEVGQTTYSREDGGSEFAEHYLYTGNQTLSDLYDNHTWGIGSNPLILVPSGKKRELPLQVS